MTVDIPTFTVNPRPAGTTIIQPGETEEQALDRKRLENAAAEAGQQIVKPTETEEPVHE